MTMKISLLILLSICVNNTTCSPSDSCNSLQVNTGSDWLDMEWSLYCGLTDPASVKAYTVSVTDTTSFIFNETLTYYCPMMNCSIHISGLHPCITYQADLHC